MKNHALKIAIAAALACPASVFATNGMNLDGYGAIARGMGGAGIAQDTGVAAIMNNPATLGLMEDGSQQIQAELSFLGPDVKTAGQSSGGDAYWMPAAGWARKSGQITYGVGVFAQGGMGTEYDFDFGDPTKPARSELGVGRVGIPLAYNVNDQLSIGATLDFVWAGLDLQMAMPGQMLGMMMQDNPPRSMPGSPGSATGTMVQGLMQAVQGGMMPMPSSARFDFSNNNEMTGAATATGAAGKLGMLYKFNDQLKLGLAYHFKSQMSDLETSNATISMEMPGMGTVAVPGSMSVRDFQWPAMMAAGASFKFNDSLTVAMDVKSIKWADVMKDFNMTFTANNGLPGMLAGFSGSQMNATLYQDWDDQTVLSLGAAYRVTPALTLRAGVNIADNPIPDTRVNYLFPAITKNHYSAGLGYDMGNGHMIDFAFIYAPEVNVTNPGNPSTPLDDMPISHSQINWSLGYRYVF